MRSLPIANPANPWASTRVSYDDAETPSQTLEIYEDASRSLLSKNDSPDVPFTWSANPYRGCMHACAYCYARPSHEYLSFGAGSDFDRKIVIKRDAPSLLREAFQKRSWKGEVVVFSGVTDCYQPLEATYHLTRQCLEVCLEYKNPAHVITKSPLIERDLELLVELGRKASVGVSISVPLLDEANARALEPFVTTPARRIKIIERLAQAGVAVGVNVAPVIPGLSDEDIPRVLEAAAGAGATRAHYAMLRLPGSVKAVFEERLRSTIPARAEKVLARLREAHGGKLYDASFGSRGRGAGPYADMIARLFETTAARLGLSAESSGAAEARGASTFERPTPQLRLF